MQLVNNPGLTGTLPDVFGSLASLHLVNLENNALSGAVPPSLAQGPKLLGANGLYLAGSGLCNASYPLSFLPKDLMAQGGLPPCPSPPPHSPAPPSPSPI